MFKTFFVLAVIAFMQTQVNFNQEIIEELVF